MELVDKILRLTTIKLSAQEQLLLGIALLETVIIFLLLIRLYKNLRQQKISEVTQQEEIADSGFNQGDPTTEAERITEELSKKGMTGQEIAQVGLQVTMFGQFIYITRATEELKKDEKKNSKKGKKKK